MTYLNTKSPCSLIGENSSKDSHLLIDTAGQSGKEIATIAQDHALA